MTLSEFIDKIYPSEEDEDTADSSAVQNNQETANTDQETEIIASIFGEKEVPIARRETDTVFKIRKLNAAGLSPRSCSPKKAKLAHPKHSTDPKPYLFDVSVTNSNYSTIPYNVAADYFPASSSEPSFSEQTIQLTDPLDRHWPCIGYVYFDSEKVFILTRNWVEYVCLFNFKLMDTVRFVRPNPCFGNNHFMTQHLPWSGSVRLPIGRPVFHPQNFLFKVEFGQGDVRLGIRRLVIDAEQVKEHFPGIRTNLKQEMVKLTDYDGTDWFVMMVYSGIGHLYILMDDQWEEFVKEHKLAIGDLVQFYRPDVQSHGKHFLIEFVKREKGNKLTKPGKSDCVSDDNRTTKTQEEPFKSSLSLVPTGISNESLSYMISESDGTKSIHEELKAQQTAYQFFETIKVPPQISATRKSSQKNDGLDLNKLNCSDSDSFGSDPDDEEDQSLVFELEIIENDCLIIPCWMFSEDFPSLILNPDIKETLQLTDYRGRKWEVTLIYDSVLDTYIIANGLSLYIQHYHLKSMDLIRFYWHVPQQNSNHFLILHRNSIDKCLFRVLVRQSNRLQMFFNRVNSYLNAEQVLAPPQQLQEYTIHVTDYLDQTWEMKLVHFLEEEAYIVVQGWEQYMAKHGLRHKDRIVFCKAKHSTKSNSFSVYHEHRRRPGSDSSSGNAAVELSLPNPENIICALFLSEADVGFGRILLPADEIPFDFLNRDMVKLTDEKSKDWFMIIVKVKEGYMITDGWEGYVKEFELEAGDMVTIYSPTYPDHNKHFLIQCEKEKKKTSGQEEEEGGIGSGNPGEAASPVLLFDFFGSSVG